MSTTKDTQLHEEDFLYVPEFRCYLETIKKKNGATLFPNTIKRHVLNVVDFLYYSSTHNYNAHYDESDEVPVDETLLRRGKDYFSSYFVGWLSYANYESEESIRQSVASIRKFYVFLKDTKRIDAAVVDSTLEDLDLY